jgi:hypothetical protein
VLQHAALPCKCFQLAVGSIPDRQQRFHKGRTLLSRQGCCLALSPMLPLLLLLE